MQKKHCNSSFTRVNLTKVLNWLDFSRVNIMVSPGEGESKCVGICSPTSSIKELLLKYWMLLESPISVDTFKFHCIPLLSLYFPNKWIWHKMSHWVRSALIQMTWGLLVTEVYCSYKPLPGFCARWSLKTWILFGTCKHCLCLGHWAGRCWVWQGHLAAPPSTQWHTPSYRGWTCNVSSQKPSVLSPHKISVLIQTEWSKIWSMMTTWASVPLLAEFSFAGVLQ